MAGTYGWFTSSTSLIGFSHAKQDGGNSGGNGGGNSGNTNNDKNSDNYQISEYQNQQSYQTTGTDITINGAIITPSEGHQKIITDLTTASNAGEKVTVLEKGIRFDKGAFSIIVTTAEPPDVQNGKATGEILSMKLQYTPISGLATENGEVSAAFQADLKGLPTENAQISASLSDMPDKATKDAFDRAATANGLGINAIAYTLYNEG